MFKRKIYDRMVSWKEEEKRSVLIIEGAGGVGKTSTVEEFGKNEYGSYIRIDLSKKSRSMEGMLLDCQSDPMGFVVRLQAMTGRKLIPYDGLVILDSIQEIQCARQAMHSIRSECHLDCIGVFSKTFRGMTLEKTQTCQGETVLEMLPMDFEEFLWARGDSVSVPILRTIFDGRESLGGGSCRVMMDRFSDYMAVGGMPQAVERFLSTGNFMEAEKVKRMILRSYGACIGRLSGILGRRVSQVFDGIPSNLSSRSRMFSPCKVESGSRNRQYRRAVEWLEAAGLINVCIREDDPDRIGADAERGSRPKCYFLDTGLLVTLASGFDTDVARGMYLSITKGRFSAGGGMFFENVVAQELKAHGHDLVFTVFRQNDVTTRYEVDFLIPGSGKISPIEVKSSASSRHKSLDVFMEKFGTRTDTAYVIHSKDLRVDGKVVYLPIYMTMFL